MVAISHKLLFLDESEWFISCRAILLQGEQPSVHNYWVGSPKAVIGCEDFFPFCTMQIDSFILQLSKFFKLITIMTKLTRSCLVSGIIWKAVANGRNISCRPVPQIHKSRNHINMINQYITFNKVLCGSQIQKCWWTVTYFCSKFSPFSMVTYTTVGQICFKCVVTCPIVTAVYCACYCLYCISALTMKLTHVHPSLFQVVCCKTVIVIVPVFLMSGQC
jgi:hypothetical protein